MKKSNDQMKTTNKLIEQVFETLNKPSLVVTDVNPYTGTITMEDIMTAAEIAQRGWQGNLYTQPIVLGLEHGFIYTGSTFASNNTHVQHIQAHTNLLNHITPITEEE